MLSKRALEILDAMITAEGREDYENAEIVCSGIECWLGEEQVSRRTVDHLLRHVAVSLASSPGETERFVVSGTGREIVKNPAVADKIRECLLAGIPCDSKGNPLVDG